MKSAVDLEAISEYRLLFFGRGEGESSLLLYLQVLPQPILNACVLLLHRKEEQTLSSRDDEEPFRTLRLQGVIFAGGGIYHTLSSPLLRYIQYVAVGVKGKH